MWKRRMCAILAAAMIAGTVAGCSGGGAQEETAAASAATSAEESLEAASEKTTEEGTETADKGLEKYEEPLTVVTLKNLSDDVAKQLETVGETVDDNRWTRLYKDRLNIELENMWVSKPDAYTEKFNVMMASGELPDIFKVNSVQFRQLLEADLLEDLTGVYEEYMNEDYKTAAQEDPYMLKAATYDGKLMGLPSKPTMPYSSTHMLWIRSDWLEKLGLSAPETMEDVIELARAFKEAKPDGVETYGIGFDKDSLSNAAGPGFRGIANSYHAYPNIWVDDGSGNLVNGVIQPEMKTVLQKLQDLYAEGLIDPEFAVKDATTYNQDIIAGKIGIVYGDLAMCLGINDLKTLNPEAEFKAYPIVSADEEPARPQASAVVDTWYVVRKGFSNPEALMKIANLNIAVLRTSLAKEEAPDGNTYAKYYGAPEDAPTAYGFVDFEFSLIPEENVGRFYICDAVEREDPSNVIDNDSSIYTNMLAYKNGDLSQWGWDRTFGRDGGAQAAGVYMDQQIGQIDGYAGLPTETMGERQATIDQLQAEYFVKIVMGEESIDAFDEFVEKWLSLGGEDITQEVNAWYQENK